MSTTKVDPDMVNPQVVSGVFNANGTIVAPAGYYLAALYISNGNSNEITGGLRIGTTNGGNDVADLGVGANSVYLVADSPPLGKRFFSETLDTTLFVQAITAWNGVTITLRAVFLRLF